LLLDGLSDCALAYRSNSLFRGGGQASSQCFPPNTDVQQKCAEEADGG
jgi:hypothetical protein